VVEEATHEYRRPSMVCSPFPGTGDSVFHIHTGVADKVEQVVPRFWLWNVVPSGMSADSGVDESRPGREDGTRQVVQVKLSCKCMT
jgi:hypothetical protein